MSHVQMLYSYLQGYLCWLALDAPPTYTRPHIHFVWRHYICHDRFIQTAGWEPRRAFHHNIATLRSCIVILSRLIVCTSIHPSQHLCSSFASADIYASITRGKQGRGGWEERGCSLCDGATVRRSLCIRRCGLTWCCPRCSNVEVTLSAVLKCGEAKPLYIYTVHAVPSEGSSNYYSYPPHTLTQIRC